MSQRFLIIRLGAVGDVVHALPLASAIRDALPGAHITWAAEPSPSTILRGNPDIDRVLTVDTRGWRRNLPAGGLSLLRRDLRALRAVRADVTLDAQGLIKSGAIALASGAKVRVGFDHRHCREGMNILFSTHQASPPERPHHVIEKNLCLLAPLGIPAPAPEALRFPLVEAPEEGAAAQGFLEREGLAGRRPLLIVHPGGGWETKRWVPERFAAVADAWPGMSGGSVLLAWGPDEEGMVWQVARAMRTPAKVAPPTSLREMAALIRRGDLFLGGDTGPTHLAAAMGVRCLTVMGPTDPVRNGPWGKGHAVLYHRLACSGCYARTCPDIECLEKVSVEEAVGRLGELWNAHENQR